MLIHSNRHTEADLKLWADLAEADAVNYRLRNVEAKASKALDDIREFLNDGKAYCTVSWGKDSTVVAHLLQQVDPTVPLVYLVDSPCANPLSPDVRGEFMSKHALPGTSYWEHRITDFREGLKRVEEAFGKRHITGIRAEESSGRGISARRWGVNSKNGCRPIVWWKAEDVFAYMACHNLPVHPAYAMLGGGRWDRDDIRVDQLGDRDARNNPPDGWCDGGFQFGRDEWEQEYFCDVLRRIGHERRNV